MVTSTLALPVDAVLPESAWSWLEPAALLPEMA